MCFGWLQTLELQLQMPQKSKKKIICLQPIKVFRSSQIKNGNLEFRFLVSPETLQFLGLLYVQLLLQKCQPPIYQQCLLGNTNKREKNTYFNISTEYNSKFKEELLRAITLFKPLPNSTPSRIANAQLQIAKIARETPLKTKYKCLKVYVMK